MPGAQLFFLDRHVDGPEFLGDVLDQRADLLTLMAGTTTRCCGAAPDTEVQRMGEHAAATEFVQHLGVAERILVPAPAARTRTAVCVSVLIDTPPRLLRRQDSNLNYLNQNQRCCRLHHDGPGAKARLRL